MESFPRGGGGSSGAQSKIQRQTKKRNIDDVLFGADKEGAAGKGGGRGSPARRQKMKKGEPASNAPATGAAAGGTPVKTVSSTSLLPVGGGGVVHPTKGEPYIESLSFGKLGKGMKVLAVVREAHDDVVIFSLPNLWTGFYLRKDPESGSGGEPPGHRLVSVGQYLSVAIVKAVQETTQDGPRRRIQVCCRPSSVNPPPNLADNDDEGHPRRSKDSHQMLQHRRVVRGQVQSIQDHGVVMDLGHGQLGFLNFTEIEGEYELEDEDEQMEEDEGDDNNEEDPGDGDMGRGALATPLSSSANRHRFHDPKRPVLGVGRILDVVVMPQQQPLAPVGSRKVRDGGSREVVLSLSLPASLSRLFLTYTPPLEALRPGMLVHVSVERVARNGICVSFAKGGMYRGAIEVQHLSGSGYLEDWRSVFGKVRVAAARLIVVDPGTKWIRLSLQPHVLDYALPPPFPEVGAVVEGARVVRLDAGVGALLALPTGPGTAPSENPPSTSAHHKSKLNDELWKLDEYQETAQVQSVYVHISKALDDVEGLKPKKKGATAHREKTPESAFHNTFALNSAHTVRILSVSNWMDGVASGATAPSVVAAHVLTHADLVPGRVYKQIPVVQVQRSRSGTGACGGVLVDFGMGVRGYIPPTQMFDATTSSHFRKKLMQSMFAVGAKVNVRVLSVQGKKCTLTAKKALVQAPDDQIITSYEAVRVGQRAVGFVTRLVGESEGGGLYVTFCNNVHGRVTAKCLESELGMDKVKENYQLGDAIICRVANVHQRPKRAAPPVNHLRRRNVDDETEVDDKIGTKSKVSFWVLTLSLKLESDSEEVPPGELVAHISRSEKVRLRAGAVLPLRSLRIMELIKGRTKPNKGFVPGYAIVSIKSKYVVTESDQPKVPEYIECKLPFDQLMDDYDPKDVQSSAALDRLAESLLIPGKKVSRKGLIMTNPEKLLFEYSSGIGKLAVVSVRPRLVDAAEAQATEEKPEVHLPGAESDLFVGATLVGYVAQIDQRHGAFVRFLGEITGLVPKSKGGLDLQRFSTITTKVVALDVAKRPMQILLSSDIAGQRRWPRALTDVPVKPGDLIQTAEVIDFNFDRAQVKLLDNESFDLKNYRARVHVTMAKSASLPEPLPRVSRRSMEQPISSYHPFHGWSIGKKLENLRVAAVDIRKSTIYLDLTDFENDAEHDVPLYVDSLSKLSPGKKVSGIITSVDTRRGGLSVKISPSIAGFIPGLELSTEPKILNNLENHFVVGCRLDCAYLGNESFQKKSDFESHERHEPRLPFFSVLRLLESDPPGKQHTTMKPSKGDLILGRINRDLLQVMSPSLMLELRHGCIGRCCISELAEQDDWMNLPFGSPSQEHEDGNEKKDDPSRATENTTRGPYKSGDFVSCRVLGRTALKNIFDVSLRPSRIEGDLDEDDAPEVGELVHAYVVDTNKKGCFLRLSRKIEGRVALKELCDGYIPDPPSSFPCGRLVVGKVKAVRTHEKRHGSAALALNVSKQADLDLRESVISSIDKLNFEDIEVGGKYKGSVTRIEEYGVFVVLENSNVSGLVHKSECSDNYVKKLSALYDPGDRVKVLVVKKDDEKRQIGFSMRASHFEGDPESDDEASGSFDENPFDKNALNDYAKNLDRADNLDSEDDSFVAKLATQVKDGINVSDRTASAESGGNKDEISSSDDSSAMSEDSDGSDADGDEAEDGSVQRQNRMDTDVGFEWGGAPLLKSEQAVGLESDSEESCASGEEDDNFNHRKSHKSRRKQAQRLREEQEIMRRETALADGTADENPETSADFERLLAGQPNSSELWIKFMAFHLATANISGAKDVAERAFERISFRQEGERLNVWCAYLTLELKYGSDDGLQKAVDRACQHNNPKHVYLRVCEMLEREAAATSYATDATLRAGGMFLRMCKKFKTKKKVWLAYVEFLLKSKREEEANAVSKKALLSLPPYKHVETMTKVASLIFEFGDAERARTLFEGLLAKYPKRLDVLFVFLDKEVKHGHVDKARAVFERQTSVDPNGGPFKMRLTDKQMKSLFKKWYTFEEQHGNDELRGAVKDAARAYVENVA